MKLPEKYLSEMKDLLQDEYEDYLRSFDEPPAGCIRINTARITVEEFLKISPFPLTPVPWCSSGFYYPEDCRPGTHPYYYAGLYYMQEASAMIPAALLDAQPGDLVLDVCAAPGGKSTAAGASLQGQGLLVSNDISASRQNATLKNIERFGIPNAYVTCADAVDLAGRYEAYFDRILCDVPCSGEGMFRREPSLIRSWEERGSDAYTSIQKAIGAAAVRMLKPGGRMVYSTCTFSVKEDEEIVQYLLSLDASLRIVRPPVTAEGFMPGILPGTENCIRLYPHRIRGEGHFAAVLEKEGHTLSQPSPVRHAAFKHPEFTAFMSMITKDFSDGTFTLQKDRVLWIPDIPFDNSSLRTVRSGLLCGTMKNNRFEPSQPLAFALQAGQFRQVIRLEPDDIRTEKYLRGETITDDADYEGWVLVCVKEWPLGFGIIKNHTIKNKIGKNFRKA